MINIIILILIIIILYVLLFINKETYKNVDNIVDDMPNLSKDKALSNILKSVDNSIGEFKKENHLNADKIEVVVHPEHIIHGLVHYNDGSIIANMGFPDMITPLSVALNWPKRLNLNLKKMSLSNIGKLTFFEPDLKKFPGLKFGWDVISNIKCSPIVVNGSNEVTVDYFLK